jgi:hypothetical protein
LNLFICTIKVDFKTNSLKFIFDGKLKFYIRLYIFEPISRKALQSPNFFI